jgi:hypothetical protein
MEVAIEQMEEGAQGCDRCTVLEWPVVMRDFLALAESTGGASDCSDRWSLVVGCW